MMKAIQALYFNKLKGMTVPEQESELGLYFINKIKTILKQEHLQFDLNTKLNDAGIDSLLAVELSVIIKSDFNTDVSISDILQKFSLNDIIKLILNTLKSDLPSEPEAQLAISWIEGEL